MGNRFIAIMLIVFAAIGVLGFAGCENDAETKETEENNTMESATESIEITAEKEQAAYVPEQGVLWTQLIRGGSGMTFLEFDIDGDGINELIGANGQVYDAGGNVTWSPSAGGTLLAIRDIDNDGKNELLMQLYGSAPTIGIVSYETGQVLWQIEYAPAASVTNVQFIILDDITGDGICELFPWFGGLEVMHCYAFDKGIENGYELWSKDFSDDVLAYVGAFAATAAAVDYDGDGVKEIMLSCHNQLVYLNGRNGSVIAGDQNNVVNNSGRNYGFATAIDVSGNGYKDIAAINDKVSRHSELILFDENGGKQAWLNNYGWEPARNYEMETFYRCIGDFTGDGKVMMAYSVRSEDIAPVKWRTYIVDALTGEYLQTIEDFKIQGADDLDGDGATELFLAYAPLKAALERSEKRIYKYQNGQFEPVWSQANCDFLYTELKWNEYDPDMAALTGDYNVPITADMDGSGTEDFFIYDYSDQKNKAISLRENKTVWESSEGKVTKVVSVVDKKSKQVILHADDGSMKLLDAAEDNKVMWTMPTYGSYEITPVFADIDGDGKAELLLNDDQKLRVYDVSTAGIALRWDLPCYGSNPYMYYPYNAVADDIDKDGKMEIIVGDIDENGFPMIRVLDYTGKTLWTKSLEKFGSRTLVQWQVAQLRDAPAKDIVVLNASTLDSVCSIISGDGNHEIYFESGSNLNGLRDFGFYSPFTVFDIDGDGFDELIFEHTDTLGIMKWTGEDFDRLEKPTWDYQPPGYGDWWGEPYIADLDGDGEYEIVLLGSANGLSVYSIDLENRYYFNEYEIPSHVRNQGVGDIDGDGRMEILMMLREDGMIHCFDGKTCEEKWAVPVPDGSHPARSILMKDLDGDGKMEAIFCTYGNGNIYIMDGEGNFIWNAQVPGGIGNDDIRLCDIDGDGQDEIFVYSSPSGNLHCIKYKLDSK